MSPHMLATVAAARSIRPTRGAGGKLAPGHIVRRTMPRARYPKTIEADYAAALVGLEHGALRAAIRPLIARLPTLLGKAAAARGDRMDVGEAADLTRLVDRARSDLSTALDTTSVERLARRYGEQTGAYQKAELQRQTRAVLGVDVAMLDPKVPTLIEHHVAENVQLIKSLGAGAANDVAKIASRALTTGATIDDVTSDIEDRFGIVERHARLIARDQIGKLNGQIATARHRELGVTRFTWRDCGDERVRPEHAALNGQSFSYDDPPGEGLPGEPVCCRCGADPVLEDLLGQLDGEDEDT